jgi:hypothetical protein
MDATVTPRCDFFMDEIWPVGDDAVHVHVERSTD